MFSTNKLLSQPTFAMSALAFALGVGHLPSAVAADSIAEAISGGSANLSLRARFEDVSIDDAEADAFTLKTRLTFKTADLAGFSSVLEFDDVTELRGEDDYFPPIADPEGTEVNQFYIQYKNDLVTSKVGNQRILIDNQRYIGGVGFRQNEVTYDAVTAVFTPAAGLTATVGYTNSRHFLNGNSFSGESVTILNVGYKVGSIGKLSGYGYLIEDLNNPGSVVVADSVDTYGVRFAGATGMAVYEAEIATQTREAVSGAEFDTDYYHLAGGVKAAGFTFKAGLETQTSDGGNGAFITPLGTNHKFGGWADKFLLTPNTGLEDFYVSAGGVVAGIKLVGVYHEFTSDVDGIDYGSEIDFLIAKKIGKNYGISLKYADYSADEFSVDTEKLWLTATANF